MARENRRGEYLGPPVLNTARTMRTRRQDRERQLAHDARVAASALLVDVPVGLARSPAAEVPAAEVPAAEVPAAVLTPGVLPLDVPPPTTMSAIVLPPAAVSNELDKEEDDIYGEPSSSGPSRTRATQQSNSRRDETEKEEQAQPKDEDEKNEVTCLDDLYSQ